MKYLLYSRLKQCNSQEDDNRGFTLIEILVVIIIIGILSSIALPSFLRAINLANEVEAKTHLTNAAKLHQQYRGEHNEFTNSLDSLGEKFPPETENYSYWIFADNSSLKGAIHIALSKQKFLSSYIRVIYEKDSDIKLCGLKPVDLSFPPLVIFDAVANPEKYCP